MSSLQSLDIAQRSATTTPSPQARHSVEVAKLIDVSSCIGCKACQVACMQWNDLRDDVGTNAGTYDNPNNLTPASWTVMRFSEVETKVAEESKLGVADPQGRLHALRRPGLPEGLPGTRAPSCSTATASSTSSASTASAAATASPAARSTCRASAPRTARPTSAASAPTASGVGLEPACVKACPTGAIRFGSKEDMHEHGATRVADLKERGYANAGVYDPQGVGGTHVMYVLQHADKPELYHGLPVHPSISPLVSLWKGAAKPLAVAAMLGAVVAGFFHYMRVGPIESKDDTGNDSDDQRGAA